ncbi:MAG TPA: hypothetical protein VGK24_05790 [Candidatus Angelobacter sp.]|jgi:hypothetical protein
MIEVIEYNGVERLVQHLPIGSLKDYGTNAYGEAIWRVVWAESHLAICGGLHRSYDKAAGGASKDVVVRQNKGRDPNQLKAEAAYKWLPLYPGVHAWVLEQWKSAISFTGMTREMFELEYRDVETGLLELGPYPDRGEYAHSYTFPAGYTPGRDRVVETIHWVEAGWNCTLGEHKEAILKENTVREKDWERRNVDAQRDARRVGNGHALNLTPGKRTTPNFNKTADELGLVRRPGPFVAGR